MGCYYFFTMGIIQCLKIFINTFKNKYKCSGLCPGYMMSMLITANYFFKRYPSILAFFLSGSSSAHALSFNRPTIMPKTSFTLLHSDLYELEFWSKAFLVNSIEYAVSLALDIFPGLYRRKCQSRLVVTIP